MDAAIVKMIQNDMNSRLHVNLTVDGIFGKKTKSQLNQYGDFDDSWPDDRLVIWAIQQICMISGIDVGNIDGIYGSRTKAAIAELASKSHDILWRTDSNNVTSTTIKSAWPKPDANSLTSYYGAVGTRQIKMTLPYPFRLAWDVSKTVSTITCHELVVPSLTTVLTNVEQAYGKDISKLGLDLFGGCLNVRQMRGGSSPSTHSWGIALDFDPLRNQLKWKSDKANFAKPEYNQWWDIWESSGWTSLGRTKNYDWMHVQATK